MPPLEEHADHHVKAGAAFWIRVEDRRMGRALVHLPPVLEQVQTRLAQRTAAWINAVTLEPNIADDANVCGVCSHIRARMN